MVTATHFPITLTVLIGARPRLRLHRARQFDPWRLGPLPDSRRKVEKRPRMVNILAPALVVTLAWFGSRGSPATAAQGLDELGDLVGYTIVAEEEIDRFEGCRVGQTIHFESGRSIQCREYGYQYDYRADAIILVRMVTLDDQRLLLCKMIVEDDVYNVDCTDYLRSYISTLRQVGAQAPPDLRAYIDEQLQLLENIGLR